MRWKEPLSEGCSKYCSGLKRFIVHWSFDIYQLAIWLVSDDQGDDSVTMESVPQRGSVWPLLRLYRYLSHTLPRCGTD